jgi:NADH-quinone oxidoreductase subunit N
MTLNLLTFKEISILPELFLGVSIIYLLIHGIFLTVNKDHPLIKNSLIYLSILILSMTIFLLANDNLTVLESTNFNYSVINDYLSFTSKILIGTTSIFCLFMFNQYLTDQKINHFEYVLLILFSILGLFLLCSSDDLLTAYLAIELQSLSFYVIAAFKKNSTFSVEAGLKYFILGAFSSSLFLFGSSLIYGISGTINFDDFKDLYFYDFSENALNSFDSTLLQFALVFILVSLFFKLALAPFHVWSPDVYEGSPSSSTFFFAVVPKIALFVLLLRIFYYSFYNFFDNFRYFLVLISVFSVLIGSFVGLEQRKLKSLLAYSSISHMGYSLLAFSTGTFEGLQMLYCYLTVYMLSGLCIWSIFFLTRLKNKYTQKQNKDLADLLLLRKSNSFLAFSFAVVLLSIAGFPPMIGFLVKFGIFLVSIEASLYFVALISILCSVISAFYYLRIVKVMYFEKGLAGKLYYPITSQKAIIVVLCLFLLFLLFINPTLLYLFSYKLSLLMLY